MEYHQRRSLLFFVSAGLVATTTLYGTPALGQQTSPFAGDMQVPTASEQITWGDPQYQAPQMAVRPESMATFDAARGRGSTGFNQSLARELQSLLPSGVSLVADKADASFISIGHQAEAAPVVPRSGDIDPEQAAELNEEVDPEQARELGGRTQPQPVNAIIVHYPVAFDGIPVSKFADVTAFVRKSGVIDVLRQRNLPRNLDSSLPSVSTEDALATAKTDAGDWANAAEISGPALEVWVDPNGNGRLSYRIEMTDNGVNPQARRYWVGAVGDGEVIYWESMIHHQHNGQVTGTIWTEAGTPTGPTANQELDQFTVTRSTGGTANTGPNGLYAFTTGGGSATMSGNLSGPNSVVNNFPGAEMTRSASGTTGSQTNLIFNATGAEETAQTTAFYWTNKAHRLAADILDSTDLPNLPTIVNRPGSCNAFWNGTSINFYVAGGSCPNMAYNSVVLHEYGHGVDARKGGIVNGGYSEGFGDAMSILGTRQSCVGQDFFGPGTCLRDAADLIMWPPGPGDGVHSQGRRYAGFVWELVQQLNNTYSTDGAYAIATQLVMGAAKANPSDIPDAVYLSFIVDDDDGDLTNGTPHFAQLAAAADSRNIPRPADPTKSVRRMGFAWAHNRTSASYTPSTTYSYNSAGGPVTATRSGVGQYAMTFAGLGGQGTAGGNVQVTGYGSTPNMCKVYWWSSGGADFRANVRCYSPSGALVDDRYTILVTWP